MPDTIAKDGTNQLGVELRLGKDAGNVTLFHHIPKRCDPRRPRIRGIPECDGPRRSYVEPRFEILVRVVKHEKRHVAQRRSLFGDIGLKSGNLCLCRCGICLVERCVFRIVLCQFFGDDTQPDPCVRRIEPSMRVGPVMGVAVIMVVMAMVIVAVVVVVMVIVAMVVVVLLVMLIKGNALAEWQNARLAGPQKGNHMRIPGQRGDRPFKPGQIGRAHV